MLVVWSVHFVHTNSFSSTCVLARSSPTHTLAQVSTKLNPRVYNWQFLLRVCEGARVQRNNGIWSHTKPFELRKARREGMLSSQHL